MVDGPRHPANDTPDAVAPPPDPSLIPDEPERGDEPDTDDPVEHIEEDGEPLGGNFA